MENQASKQILKYLYLKIGHDMLKKTGTINTM